MNEIDPSKRLIKEKNIWNLAIIDSIDFKEKTFKFEIIKHKILNRLDYGSCGESPNIVILEPGLNPNSDNEILHVAEMYKKNFAMKDYSFLGQWHTSKDFYLVLLVLFFSYRLLSLASYLGVHFLNKFESAIDYRLTAQVLDFIWIVVGVAINIYITKKEILFSEIMNDEENNHIYLKIGMCVENFRLQQDSLSAAGPLYASTAKLNYTMAIVHFLATIAAYSQLEEKLNYYSAFKILHDIDSDLHYVCFEFDESLETFGVRFIKENISRNVIDEKNLKIK
ncbi:hypothetical protein C1646_755108 [Rhizophagus diaphanus]|nr:hypothetical protein C1646_755108 [Rhizophagus diaphanus] [Rhizophagus sp. MUCL 43196]